MDTSSLTIETENLLVKSITPEYSQVIFTEFTPQVTVYMYPKPFDSIEGSIEFIKKSIKENKAGTNFQCVVLKKDTGEFLGCAGVHNIGSKTPEFGIWIKKSAHGHGYGREAVVGLKKWADENLDYDYILYPADRENIASRKIPEFLGGKIVKEYSEVNKSGKKLNIVEYRIYR